MNEFVSPEQNVQEWTRRGQRNLVKEQIERIREAAEALVKPNGLYRAIAVSGPPGVETTHIFDEVFDKAGITVRKANSGSTLGLIDDLFLAGKGVAIFEDADRLWNSQANFDILKKAFDDEETNRVIVSNISGKLRKAEVKNHLNGRPFKVRCRGVFLTNKDITDLSQFPARVRPHIQAINSRVLFFSLYFDLEEMWEYTCYLAIVEDLLRKKSYSLHVANEALRYMTETVGKANDASPCRLLHIAKTIRAFPEHWEKVLGVQLPPPAQSRSWSLRREIPEIRPVSRRPEVVLAPVGQGVADSGTSSRRQNGYKAPLHAAGKMKPKHDKDDIDKVRRALAHLKRFDDEITHFSGR